MATNEQTEIRINGKMIAENVTYDEYMERYAAYFCEWIDGVVIQMSPVGWKHNKVITYICQLIEAYFELRPIGVINIQP
ncbi:MAG TPA: Uma2 family endonuclease, partial [Phototrophicaceae bacterium]|nr:Uma2 family endonuclease [Phototrophicaceae bacterium]